jgi:hypothetical protein
MPGSQGATRKPGGWRRRRERSDSCRIPVFPPLPAALGPCGDSRPPRAVVKTITHRAAEVGLDHLLPDGLEHQRPELLGGQGRAVPDKVPEGEFDLVGLAGGAAIGRQVAPTAVVHVLADDRSHGAVEGVLLRLAAVAIPVAARLEDRLRVRVAGNLFGRAGIGGRELAAGRNQRPCTESPLARQFDSPPVAAVVDENAAWNSASTSH